MPLKTNIERVRLICGIDPGVTGGIAFLYEDGLGAACDIPTINGEVNGSALRTIFRQLQPDLTIIERAQAMPKQGVVSTFKFGQAYGTLRGILAGLGLSYNLVGPREWKKHFALDADKEKSRRLAIDFWGPEFFNRKKDHGRAEAALIAKYGMDILFRKREAA